MASSGFVITGSKGFTNFDNRSFTQIIVDSLKINGKRTAFIDYTTEEKITYEEFLEQSLALSIAFESLDFKNGDIICFLMENHIKYFIPYISALLCGITVHPLNPEYSDYELNHVLNLTKPKIIIASNYTLQKAIGIRSKYVFVKTIINVDTCKQEDVLDMNNLIHTYKKQACTSKFKEFDESNQDTLILNSSGTTGLPKGVIATHMNLKYTLNFSTHKEHLDMNSEDVVPYYLPNFHIFAIFIFISTITAGGMGIVFQKFSLAHLLKSVENYKVTKIFAVPTIVLQLTKGELVQDYDLSSIKDVFSAASPLGKEVEKLFIARFGFKVRQIYGSSELTGGVAGCIKSDQTLSTLGRLVPQCSAKILDIRTNMPLPPYKAGEMCFRGAMVMKGYFGNPEATKEVIDEDGYLHTGDYGYYDENGNFYLVDRLKDIIKYKGWQVAPAQIEDLIKTLSEVKDVAVVGKPDDRAGELAVAVVVKEPNSDITDQDIIKLVSDNVVVPSRLHGGVIFVDAIPKTTSGKVLKSKIREQLGFGSKIVIN